MKFEEAISYFERELKDCEEAKAWAAANPVDEEPLASCAYEREALLLALGALRLAQKYGQSEEFAKSPIHKLFVRLVPNASNAGVNTPNAEANASAALKGDERRSMEENT